MNKHGRLGFIYHIAAIAPFFILAFALPVRAGDCIKVSPSNLQVNFGSVAVGTQSLPLSHIDITNNCQSDVTLQTMTITASEFHLVFGYAPSTLIPRETMHYFFTFVPDAAQVFNGSFNVTIPGYSPVMVSLTGTGFITHAVDDTTPTSLTFGNQAVGSVSAPQTVTYKNTGTSPFEIESLYVEPPFIVKGFSQPVTLQGGQSLNVYVSFIPTYVGAASGTLVMTSNVLPPRSVPITGTATDANTLSVLTFPTLATGTSGYAYLANLLAAAGTPPYNWSLATGSKLPSGLSLSSPGAITGSIAAKVGAGNYQFTVQVTDSSNPPNTESATLTLPVASPNGAECNNISFNIAGTRNPLVPLTDLGTGHYFGVQGGLYLDGSNTMPASHDAAGVSLAQSIQPLDANGDPDPNGKIGVLSLGMSNTANTFNQFIQQAQGDPAVNSHVVFVPGAQPSVTALRLSDLSDGAWAAITDFFAPQLGVTDKQIEVAWFVDVDENPSGTFPGDIAALETEYIAIAQNLHTIFPNLKLAYFGSRYYAGYSNGLAKAADPEPYAYEDGFAIRAVILDQINGDPALNYNPDNGPVMAPWLAWGPYDWANGMIGRSDGLVWPCGEFQFDGTHLLPAGEEFDANILENFFLNTDTTMPWFVAPAQKQSAVKKAQAAKMKR